MELNLLTDANVNKDQRAKKERGKEGDNKRVNEMRARNDGRGA